MATKILKNKPLIEAIFELRWDLQEPLPGLKVDPQYKLLIGQLYDRLSGEYPFHEELPTTGIPDEVSAYAVKHRFRKSQNGWPLIQIGPGIITVNDTEGYIWDNFKERIRRTISALFGAYPQLQEQEKVSKLVLRYIDAIHFDYNKDNILTFLNEKMKTNLGLCSNLFDNPSVRSIPLGIDSRFAFSSEKPKGVAHLRFARGMANNMDSLIWETMVESDEGDTPKSTQHIYDWIVGAHDLADDWFFKLIDGELLRRFE